MSDVRTRRISREVFLAAVGGSAGALEPWVTDRLTAVVEEEGFGAGDLIFAAGTPPDHFYFAREGRIEFVRNGKLEGTVDAPRAFGMVDGLIERPRSHAAYARAPMQVLKIRMDAWLELLEDSFELARMALLRWARNVASLEEGLWASGRAAAQPAPFVLGASGAELDVVDRLGVLMQTPPLRGAGVQPLSDLAAVCEDVSFAAGERLFESGVPMDSIFVLVDGRVEASRENPRIAWRGGAGQAVCGVVSFAEQGTAWEAHATTATRALAFSIDDWFDVMEENFEMVRATLASLAREHERLGGGF